MNECCYLSFINDAPNGYRLWFECEDVDADQHSTKNVTKNQSKNMVSHVPGAAESFCISMKLVLKKNKMMGRVTAKKNTLPGFHDRDRRIESNTILYNYVSSPVYQSI